MSTISRRYILTNTWTHANHGHARSELNQVSNFIENLGFESRIVSIAKDFGISHYPSVGRLAHNFKLDHLRYFKAWIDSRMLSDLQRNILYELSKKEKTNHKIVLTSIKYDQVFKLENLWLGQRDVAIRLLSVPSYPENWKKLIDLIKKAEFSTTIAVESIESATFSKQLYERILHVPAAQSLRIESNETNLRRNRIGLFFPVGRKVNESRVVKLLEIARVFQPIVKLPNNFKNKCIEQNFPEVEFISNGTSDDAFQRILSTVKVAILGHENYVNQSSAYANYFVSNGVAVVTSPNNDFFSEFPQGRMFALLEEKKSLINLLTMLMSSESKSEDSDYALYAQSQWREFLMQNDSSE